MQARCPGHTVVGLGELRDHRVTFPLTSHDWGGGVEISNVAASVGAFPLPSGSSHDAVLLVTLAPGPYSVRLTGVGGAGGTALVELYDIP